MGNTTAGRTRPWPMLLAACAVAAMLGQLRREIRHRRRADARARLAREAYEEQVRARSQDAAQADDLRDHLLAMVSHELRTPLNAIIGWVQLLKEGVLEPHDVARALDAIDRNARVQTQMVTNLLDVSRMMQGHLVVARAPVDLTLLVEGVVDAMRPVFHAAGVRLVSAAAPDIHVLGDARRLRQLVEQLMLNAVKFTPGGGSVEVVLAADGTSAELRVRDTGIGVDRHVLPRVFAPFYQARSPALRSGLGLGLAIVSELAHLHGGTVNAESEGEGAGATFVVRLPLACAPQTR